MDDTPKGYLTQRHAAGPALETYLETRLNLLLESIKERFEARDATLVASIEAAKATAVALKSTMEAAQTASDLRYQQRFEAQSDALAAAFASQQAAMQTAFTVAEKAVQAALAAADRAVSKAELASDKRFEALNELRQMLNDTLQNLMTRPEVTQQFKTLEEKETATNARIDTLEKRVNVSTGTEVGERRIKEDSKSIMAIIISVFTLLAAVAVFAFTFFKSATPQVIGK